MADYIILYLAESEEPVSEDGSMTNPIRMNLRTDQEEEEEVRLYLECEPGFQVRDIIIVPVGDTYDMWALAPDVNEESGEYMAWGGYLNVEKVAETEKFYFWAKARTKSTEQPKKDSSVNLKIDGIVEPL